MQAAAGAVLHAVKSRLTAQDQDQEVKECAVSCAAALIAQLGDCLQQEYSNLMRVMPRPPPALPACTCAPMVPRPFPSCLFRQPSKESSARLFWLTWLMGV